MTTVEAPATAAWISLLREMHTAGWRHTTRPMPVTFSDPPPWQEREWTRGDDVITAYLDIDKQQWFGSIDYQPAVLGDGTDDMVQVGVAIARTNGPDWLRQVMVLNGIIPRDYEIVGNAITRDWMAHLGYTPSEIDAAEAMPDHSECEYTEGGWDCSDEHGNSRHAVYDEMYQHAELIMFVLEHRALT